MLLFSAPATWAAAGASAFNPAITFNGYYEFKCNGVRFGKMGIALEQTPSRYSITSDITTTGLLKIFVPHKSHTSVQGRGEHFSYTDITYESRYQTRNKKKYVKMIYTDGMPHETLEPPDNPAKRPPPPPGDKRGAADPLSLILRMRAMLHDALEENNRAFQLKYYDGRRLTLIKVAIEGRQAIAYDRQQFDTIRVALRRELLGGFSQSEIEKYSPDEPVVYAYFTDDSRLMPILLETHVWFGQLTAELVRECATGESCLLGFE